MKLIYLGLLSSLLFCITSVSALPVDFNLTGLMLEYHNNNDSIYGENSTCIYDFSTNGNNGSVEGNANFTSSGKFGSALELDGLAGYINSGNDASLEFTDEITLEVWFKGYDFGVSTYHTIIRDYLSYYITIKENGQIYNRLYVGGVWKAFSGYIGDVSINNWYHLVMSYDKNRGGQVNNLEDYDGLVADANNPIIADGGAGEWDDTIREIGNVVYDVAGGSEKYKTFYSGHNGTYNGSEVYIGYANSSDGLTWTKRGQVISRALEDPYVVYNNSVYYLYAEDKADVPFRNIRRYNSTDCISWNDEGDVLDIQGSGWESTDVSSPIVWIEGDTWYMLYEGRGSGSNGKIGYANSSDGLTWVRYDSNPVLDYGDNNNWDSGAVVSDDIMKSGSTYYLLYHGHDGSDWGMGMATSTDLYNWNRYKYSPITSLSTCMFFINETNDYIFHCDNSGIGRYYPTILSSPQIFLNGVEIDYSINGRPDCGNVAITPDTGSDLNLGRSPNSTGYYFEGIIDVTRLWNRALSEEEIECSYNEGSCLTSNPSVDCLYTRKIYGSQLHLNNVTYTNQTIHYNGITIIR